MFGRTSIDKTIDNKFSFLTTYGFTINKSQLCNEHCWSYSNNKFTIKISYDDKIFDDMLKRNYNHKYVIEIKIEWNGIDGYFYDRYDLFGAENIDRLKAQISVLESQPPKKHLISKINLYADFIKDNVSKN